jgi:hypothetical protein
MFLEPLGGLQLRLGDAADALDRNALVVALDRRG